VSDSESIRAIHCALDAGVNWIDTAAAYGLGHSEEIVARALQGRRHKVFVATKCGLVSEGKGEVVRNSRPESIRQELEASLRRLNTDYIDLYQIHWHDAEVPVEHAWGALVRARDEGKVRFIGVSNYDVPLLRRCQAVARVQSLQPPYSMINRGIEHDVLPFCRDAGIGVIVYSPMQSGILTGRYDPDRLAPDDWRRRSSSFLRPEVEGALRLVDRLRPVAAKYNVTVGQLAVAWVLRSEGVTSAIVGARTSSQVEENVRAADLIIEDDDMILIRTYLEEHT
jgi:aryl-alcohol dehydrogenase-like predicted oxidoreductase